MKPLLSKYFQSKSPSATRITQNIYLKRKDKVEAIRIAAGNINLPAYPAFIKILKTLTGKDQLFSQGVIKYSETIGTKEANLAFLNVIASSGYSVSELYSQITEGASNAIELAILAVCGEAGAKEKPLLVLNPVYADYISFAERTGRSLVSVTRYLKEDGHFTLPPLDDLEKVIQQKKPNGLLIIPYDNPTGQLLKQNIILKLADLCVKYNLWIISDETYRNIYYTGDKPSSIWSITEKDLHGIIGRRISIESSSKIWNSCGLRIGALVTDNQELHEKAVSENTANICANSIGQYIFSSLAYEKTEDMVKWYKKQINYYKNIIFDFVSSIKKELPRIIVSLPQASVFSVIDLRNLVDPNFSATDFAIYCAQYGKVDYQGKSYTLLFCPMEGFYNIKKGEPNPGKTQIRVAYVDTPVNIKKVPYIFAKLLKQYCNQ